MVCLTRSRARADRVSRRVRGAAIGPLAWVRVLRPRLTGGGGWLESVITAGALTRAFPPSYPGPYGAGASIQEACSWGHLGNGCMARLTLSPRLLLLFSAMICPLAGSATALAQP